MSDICLTYVSSLTCPALESCHRVAGEHRDYAAGTGPAESTTESEE